jgi:hypothetical protein
MARGLLGQVQTVLGPDGPARDQETLFRPGHGEEMDDAQIHSGHHLGIRTGAGFIRGHRHLGRALAAHRNNQRGRRQIEGLPKFGIQRPGAGLRHSIARPSPVEADESEMCHLSNPNLNPQPYYPAVERNGFGEMRGTREMWTGTRVGMQGRLPTRNSRWLVGGALGMIALAAAACGSSVAAAPPSAKTRSTAKVKASTLVSVMAVKNGTLGTILVNQAGLTLYTYSSDGKDLALLTYPWVDYAAS